MVMEQEPEVEVELEAEPEVEVELEEGAAAEGAEHGAGAELVEVEGDDEHDDSVDTVRYQPALSANEVTPNVFFSGGGLASAVACGPLRGLLAGVRSDTGAKKGRYMFEVQVLGKAPETEHALRVGFSTAGSSLFLGDSADSLGFDETGAYHVAEPGQLEELSRPRTCEPLLNEDGVCVIGVLLNVDCNSAAVNTVSIFVDGRRTCEPQPIPSHLHGQALFPTVTFRGLTVAVNLGAHGAPGAQLAPLPFTCSMFAQAAQEHHAALAGRGVTAEGPPRLVVPIALPELGAKDAVRKCIDDNPGMVEISDDMFSGWCRKSGTKMDQTMPAGAWRDALVTLAVLSRRSCLVATKCDNLLPAGRRELLGKFPACYQKTAYVAIGDPGGDHRSWLKNKVQKEYEQRRADAEKRLMIAEASGLELEGESAAMPEEPDASLEFLPREEADAPEVVKEELGNVYSDFELPTSSEAFSEVVFAWSGQVDADDHLRRWVIKEKASFLVDNLRPGDWFREQLEMWKTERKKLRQGHLDYSEKRAAEGLKSESDGGVDLASIKDIHDVDGQGTPLYANFRYEDWVLLSWRYELHLLAHAFSHDVGDADIPGIPAVHVAHYYGVYYGAKFDSKGKLGAADIHKALAVLSEPVEFAVKAEGQKVLSSRLDRNATIEDFVRGVEGYRRDRKRRLDAGDESAQLALPRPAAVKKPEAKAPVAKAAAVRAPGVNIMKAPAFVVQERAKAAGGPAGPQGGNGVKRPAQVAPPAQAKQWGGEPPTKKGNGVTAPKAVAKSPSTSKAIAKEPAW